MADQEAYNDHLVDSLRKSAKKQMVTMRRAASQARMSELREQVEERFKELKLDPKPPLELVQRIV